MKKFLLLLLIVPVCMISYAQRAQFKQDVKQVYITPVKEKMTIADRVMPVNNTPVVRAEKITPPMNANRGTDVVTIIDIGSAANAYGYGYNNGAATFVWADQNLHSVSNLHRMGGAVGPPGQYSGDLAYDLSTDGGMTWSNQIKVYESNISGGQYNLDAARYPEGLIYNPPGNTDPNNAWVAFFAANLDGSNGGTWGGYSYGIGSIANPDDTTKHLLSSDLGAGFYQGIPTAFTITQGGEAWMADASLLDSYVSYNGDIIFMHGVFNTDINDMEYDEFLVPAECDYARYLKIAFSPDGQIGYVFWNNFNGSIPSSEGWSYPLLLKTTDGGQTWADELISVELSGPDGIDAVKNYLTDAQLEELFGLPIPDRDDILYTSPYFNSDVSVDAFGNPHLALSVFVAGADPGYIVIVPETFAVFDIYSMDQSHSNWYGVHVGTLKTYEGLFQPDDFNEYNRVQIASTMDGTKMFFTWLDTRLEGVDQNTSPDIYARGFDLLTNKITDGDDVAGATNVTAFSEGMWQSYFQCTSAYVFESDPEGTYTIPIVYEDLNPDNVVDPVQFKYIQDFSYSDADFTIDTGNPPFPVGIAENNPGVSMLSVSQNRPNPVKSTTEIEISLKEAAHVNVFVTSLTGQKVLEINAGWVKAGKRLFKLDASDLSDGVYFYTVSAGHDKITKKMIVE